jgi:hypothetical protein
MYLLKDITADLIPWPNEILFSVIFICIELLLGIIINLVIIYSLLKQRDIPIDSQFILSLSVADFLFSASILGLDLFNVVRGGWAAGQAGCLFSAIVGIYTLGMSVLSISAMTMHRYLVVVQQFHLTQKHVYMILAALWCGLAIMVAIFASFSQQFRENGIGLTTALMYCFIAVSIPDDLNIVTGSLCLVFVLFAMAFLVFAYYRIIATYSKLLTRKRSRSALLSADKIQRSRTEQETRLIKKAIAIAGSFILCMFCVYCFID